MIHSQFDEEKVILEFFGDKNDGTVLDIGAYNYVTFSNSRALINKGWSAVLVEPSPRCFSSLMRSYQGAEKVKLLNAFVSDSYGIIEFFDSEGAVATADKAHFEAWNKVQKDFQTIFIPKINAYDIKKIVDKCDFVTIDCEGNDLPVVKALPWGILKPSLVCVEYGNHGAELEQIFKGLGYVVHHVNQANAFFKKEWPSNP